MLKAANFFVIPSWTERRAGGGTAIKSKADRRSLPPDCGITDLLIILCTSSVHLARSGVVVELESRRLAAQKLRRVVNQYQAPDCQWCHITQKLCFDLSCSYSAPLFHLRRQLSLAFMFAYNSGQNLSLGQQVLDKREFDEYINLGDVNYW
ncbi:hypothetical protein DPMN_131040 [Dreissena polymorpha]|uniref:Uncharacterized protein n=1 Tax=Dreissena polymorpha TaxID=45954 RepID=A0A9D4HC43_DREPO|nr:hypothetical protein DPMN_131040 [Dreissena polymorpha]